MQHRDGEQKSYVEITPVPVCWTRQNLTIHLCQGTVGTHIKLSAVVSTYLILLDIYSGVTVPNMIEIGWHSTKLLQNTKRVQFILRHSVYTGALKTELNQATSKPDPKIIKTELNHTELAQCRAEWWWQLADVSLLQWPGSNQHQARLPAHSSHYNCINVCIATR